MATKRILSATEVSDVFKSDDRIRNTKYLCSVLNNPESPIDNVDLVTQYYNQHPEKFLNNEEIDGNKTLFFKKKKYTPRVKGRQMVGGRFYNPYTGEEFDVRGNPVGGWGDSGGYYGQRRSYGPSGSFFRESKKNDPSQALSASKVNQLMFGLRSNYARTRYFQKVRDNPDSNPETVAKLKAWKDQHPDLMVSEEAAAKISAERKNGSSYRRNGSGGYHFAFGPRRTYYPKSQTPYGYRSYGNGYGRNYPQQKRGWFARSSRDYDKESFDSAWAPKEEFDTFSPKHKSLLSRFIKSKDRNKNSKLALKILSSGDSSSEDVIAVKKIVASQPRLFFKGKS